MFPALGTWAPKAAQWSLSVRLWVYRSAREGRWRRDSRTRAVGDTLVSETGGSGGGEGQDARVAALLAAPVAGRRLTIQLGRLLVELPASDAEGHVLAEVDVPLDAMPPRGGPLEMRVVTSEGDRRDLVGPASFVTPTGRLVVSDVFDTVVDVRPSGQEGPDALLNDLVFVDGIGAGLARLRGDGHLHFLSSWPHQLFPTMRAAFDEASVPPATFDLTRWRPSSGTEVLFRENSIEDKLEVLDALAKRLPSRQWILIGDSRGNTPEAFGAFARDHGALLDRIYIRDVTGQARSEPRYQRAFASVPDDRWRLFSTGDELD